MRRASVVLLVTLVALTVLPAAPAAAETTVTVKGNVISITMTVDVVGAADKHPTAPNGQPLVDYWSQILQDTWGAAFDQLPYKNCFKLQLKIKLKERKAGFDSKDGDHRIIVGAKSGGSFEGTGFQGESETTRNPKTGDGTRSFEHDRYGAIPEDAPPTVVAHEFGHLFGLGDDRKDGAPTPGRDGTMMVGGVPSVDVNVVQRIDQDLVDRLGEVIRKHLDNQGKKLAKCQTWSGTVHSTWNGEICTGSTEGTITVGVVGGDASGPVAYSSTSTCPAIPYSGSGSVTATLSGKFTGDEFRFLVGADIVSSGDPNSTACLSVPDRPIVVPVTERGTAQASFEWSIGTEQYTCEITLERQTDDEPVG